MKGVQLKRYLLTFLFIASSLILLSSLASADVVINEVMYNPPEGGYDNESVELYSDSFVNFSGWVVADLSGDDTLVGLYYASSSYALIVTEDFNYSGLNASIYSAGARIGNGLNNNGIEVIFLYIPNGTLEATATYDDSMGADGDGNSLQLCNGTLIPSTPTPVQANICTNGGGNSEKTLDLSHDSKVECNENFTITATASNFDEGTYDVKIDIKDVEDNSRVGEVWNGTNWWSTIRYINSILDVNNGTGSATLTFKIEDFDGEAVLEPKIRDISDEFDESYLTVTCSSSSSSEDDESTIEIVDYPSTATFGEVIDVEIKVYKGDTSKYAVYTYVEDKNGKKVSEKETNHFRTKFKEYEETIRVQLKCKGEDGTYNLIVEGLGLEEKEKINLKVCTNAELSDGDFNYKFTFPSSIKTNQEFEVKTTVTSNIDSAQEFLAWSYVFHGPKCYSCAEGETRESNSKIFTVNSKSSDTVSLKNVVKEAESRDYKLKIKVLKQGLKTPKEFTYNITIDSGSEGSELELVNINDNTNQDSITSSAVLGTIESKSSSFSKFAIYAVISIFLLLIIYLIVKKM